MNLVEGKLTFVARKLSQWRDLALSTDFTSAQPARWLAPGFRELPAQDDQDAAWRPKNRVMLIALLAVLGVDLIVIVVLVAVLLTRRAWVSRQPGTFKGAIRVADGEVPGLRPKWKRGFGRWVGGVLVWTVAPFLFRNVLIEADRTTNEIRQTGPDDKVRRVGSSPVIMVVAADGARIEVATAADQRERALGRPADHVPVRQLDAGRPGRHERPPSAGDAPDRDSGLT